MEKNIVLIGMMGCGKSTIGALLAQRLGRELVDTDALIEKREGRSIPDIFAREGEEHFRALEQAAAEELAARGGLVKGRDLVPVYHRLSQAERERLERENQNLNNEGDHTNV